MTSPSEWQTVHLTYEETERAAMVGVFRHVEAIYSGRKAGWGVPSELWETHFQGACAELALAKWMNIHWTGWRESFTDEKRPDVGGECGIAGCEVRWAKDGSRLKRRPKDPATNKFVLATGELPNIVLVGWIPGTEFERIGEWADPGNRGRPCWWIRRDQLLPMAEIF